MATTGGEPVFLDTNVLVYATQRQSPFHLSARAAIQRWEVTGAGLWLSRQVLREYLAALSRPQQFLRPVPMAVLTADVRSFARRFQVVEDGPQVSEQLLSLVEQFTVGGKQVHDANIVATMLVHGVRRLLTHNTGDFARYGELITILPVEAAS